MDKYNVMDCLYHRAVLTFRAQVDEQVTMYTYAAMREGREGILVEL